MNFCDCCLENVHFSRKTKFGRICQGCDFSLRGKPLTYAKQKRMSEAAQAQKDAIAMDELRDAAIRRNEQFDKLQLSAVPSGPIKDGHISDRQFFVRYGYDRNTLGTQK